METRPKFRRAWVELLPAILLFPAIWVFFHVLSFAIARFPEPIGSRSDMLIEGARTTLELTIVAGLAGVALGLFLGIAKVAKAWWWRWPSSFVIWLVRGTPLLVQIFFVYYALPALNPKLAMDEFAAGVTALAINVGAYNAEVIRAGIEAVPRGQTEAALSLGLSGAQAMRFIIVPQALRIVIPPLINNIVALLKDSSLVSAIGLLELALAGNRISSETFLPVPVLSTVALIYLTLTTGITFLTDLIENRLVKKVQ